MRNDILNQWVTCQLFLKLNVFAGLPLLARPLPPNIETVRGWTEKSAGNATAPEFQPPACCSFPVVLLWSGSWLTPTRGNPDGYVTERSRLWKEEKVVSRARSINWAASGLYSRGNGVVMGFLNSLKAQRYRGGIVKSGQPPCWESCRTAAIQNAARVSRKQREWISGWPPCNSGAGYRVLPQPHNVDGPVSHEAAPCFFVLAHGL